MWIGNHSYDHPHLTTLSQSQIDSEIGRTQTAIASAGGGTPKLFRPPYGETNSAVKAVEAKYGLTKIIWNIDSQDWNGASVAQIVQANSRLTNGRVILVHEWPANLSCPGFLEAVISGKVGVHGITEAAPRRATGTCGGLAALLTVADNRRGSGRLWLGDAPSRNRRASWRLGSTTTWASPAWSAMSWRTRGAICLRYPAI